MNADVARRTTGCARPTGRSTQTPSCKLSDALAAGSCRPWVAIERREITVLGGGRYRYRFEIDAAGRMPLANAASRSCSRGGGDGAGRSERQHSCERPDRRDRVRDAWRRRAATRDRALRQSRSAKAGRFRSSTCATPGRAHGRLEGFLEGTDARGRRIEFTPAGLPILPGETREIALNVAGEGDKPATDGGVPDRDPRHARVERQVHAIRGPLRAMIAAGRRARTCGRPCSRGPTLRRSKPRRRGQRYAFRAAPAYEDRLIEGGALAPDTGCDGGAPYNRRRLAAVPARRWRDQLFRSAGPHHARERRPAVRRASTRHSTAR